MHCLPRTVWKSPRPLQRLHPHIPRLPLLPAPVRLETPSRGDNPSARMAAGRDASESTPAHHSPRTSQAMRCSRASQGPDYLGAGHDCEVVERDTRETGNGEGSQSQCLPSPFLIDWGGGQGWIATHSFGDLGRLEIGIDSWLGLVSWADYGLVGSRSGKVEGI